jgi:hypothetical protein
MDMGMSSRSSRARRPFLPLLSADLPPAPAGSLPHHCLTIIFNGNSKPSSLLEFSCVFMYLCNGNFLHFHPSFLIYKFSSTKEMSLQYSIYISASTSIHPSRSYYSESVYLFIKIDILSIRERDIDHWKEA